MSDDQNPHIKEKENGPLLARYIESFVGSDGKEIETKPNMPLCRCGHSENKPFCDGSHNDAGFQSRDDKEPSGRDVVKAYEGGGMTVHYNPRICSHAARCIARVPEVFDPDARPWIQPQHADADKIEAAVRACPSGALQIDRDGSPEQLMPSRAQITVEKNGPTGCRPPIEDLDVPGAGGSAEKYVLCRCGLSGNKPYCDGSHHDAGWDDGTG